MRLEALAETWTEAQAAELIAKAVPMVGAQTADDPQKPKTRDFLIGLLGDAELWYDPERVAYATATVDGHRENHELGSNGFKD